MGNFENKLIYPKIENKYACYHRFIADIFMLWTGTEEELLSFFEDIKFDYNYSKSEISFPDTLVFKSTLMFYRRNSIPNLQIDQLIYIISHTTPNH